MTTGPDARTHDHDGPLAVFLIGMTVNQPLRLRAWLPSMKAMGPMIRELYANQAAAARGEAPDLGFRGARTTFGLRGPTVIQYWRSVEDIYAYAHQANLAHRPAWTAFNQRARRNPQAVGIWHETFAVPEGGHESVYRATPTLGLGAAFGLRSRREVRRAASAARGA